jgi:hypothetical protein|tara:strand:- start:1924 stop:2772 length:849 start_codon:yes stop_codon:yes gene_type:complete
MHKKLESDLISLAHSILQMKNKENVFLLKQKAYEIYEKLSVLAFVEEYVNTTPGIQVKKEELILKVEEAYKVKDQISKEVDEANKVEVIEEDFKEVLLDVEKEKTNVDIEDNFSNEEKNLEEIEDQSIDETKEFLEVKEATETEQPFNDLESLIFGESEIEKIEDPSEDIQELKDLTLEEELDDTIPVDIIADLFEPLKPSSLNDKLQTNIQIGLNDRIVFVKNLFEGSQEDFNRVISQLNTFKTEKEAKKFITKMVKPDYNWSEKEELENRLITIIEKRFA